MYRCCHFGAYETDFGAQYHAAFCFWAIGWAQVGISTCWRGDSSDEMRGPLQTPWGAGWPQSRGLPGETRS